ncbi:hypothetical protein ACMAZE_12680 [Pseudopelagicola sp. nBUS_20]|uniref:hypothetical protein n=1 Tax=Pseudopelagicola sp. nBUS_20 TaxID=3395317 RepID=UPI003EB7850C
MKDIAALGIEAERYKKHHYAIYEHGIFREVRDIIERQKDNTICSIKNDGMSPRALVHLLITNVVYERLIYGDLHWYRGKLNFQGNNLCALFHHSSRILV